MTRQSALGPPPEALPFSLGINAGGFVFLSGTLALDAQGEVVEGIENQCEFIFGRMQGLLAEANLTLEHIVKINAWIVAAEHFRGFNRVYRKTFPTTPPARSTVISGLLVPDALIEMEAIAWRGLGSG